MRERITDPDVVGRVFWLLAFVAGAVTSVTPPPIFARMRMLFFAAKASKVPLTKSKTAEINAAAMLEEDNNIFCMFFR